MRLTEITLTMVLGAVGGVISFEIWGWLATVNRALDEARRRIADENPRDDEADRFSERRITGIAWSTLQLIRALGQQIRSGRHPAQHLDMAAYGSALGGVFAISYVMASLLVGGAPASLSTAAEQVGGWGAVGAVIGYWFSHGAGLIRGG